MPPGIKKKKQGFLLELYHCCKNKLVLNNSFYAKSLKVLHNLHCILYGGRFKACAILLLWELMEGETEVNVPNPL